VQRRHIHRWDRRRGCGPEHPGGLVEKLACPWRDLVGMDIELLGQLADRVLSPLTAASATFALKAGL
jgi:hypothetical protein